MSLVITYLSGLAFNLISGLLFTLGERLRPFRAIPYRRRLLRDFGALAYVWVLFVSFVWIEDELFKGSSLAERMTPQAMRDTPLWVRIVVFYVIYDFLSYWAHRLMHRPGVWKTHAWHHSPSDIWWLSGCRGSLIHVALYRLAGLVVLLCLFSPIVTMLISVEMILSNSWMHWNVRWYAWMRHLEIIFVTPRFHHLHHGVGPEFHDMNFGSRFTIWDRWFGTFLDPDQVDPARLHFGVSERDRPTLIGAAIGL